MNVEFSQRRITRSYPISKPRISPDIIYNSELPIVGNSDKIIDLRKKIELSSKSNFIFFVSGEDGCEKKSVAWNLHKLSPSNKGEFMTIPSTFYSAESYRQCVMQSLNRAKNGTLFIEDIDNLSKELKDELISLIILEKIDKIISSNNIKLILSSNTQLNSHSDISNFIYNLIPSERLIFNLHVPPLRERKEDIESHIRYLGSTSNKKIDVTDAALDALKAYHWPKNTAEFYRKFHILMSRYSSEITDVDVSSLNLNTSNKPDNKNELLDAILEKNTSVYKNTHPSLAKALNYLSHNFQKEVSLSELAENAFISASHLSYLFRRHLDYSFKSVLCQVRIKFSQSLMKSSPRTSITDIALQSGFGDLSHFEKMFRRHVGCTPRAYREQYRRVESHHMIAI